LCKKISSTETNRTSTRNEKHHNNEEKKEKNRNKPRKREKSERYMLCFVRFVLFCLGCVFVILSSREGTERGIRRCGGIARRTATQEEVSFGSVNGSLFVVAFLLFSSRSSDMRRRTKTQF
jgi:hypothetical protein